MTTHKLYKVKIKKRFLLSKEGSCKKTYHLVLDIKDKNINFKPGDCAAIKPKNSSFLVTSCIKAMKADFPEKTKIYYKKEDKYYTLEEILKNVLNISKVPSSLLKFLKENLTDIDKTKKLEDILKDPDKLSIYLKENDLLDVLEEFFSSNITPQEICSFLLPLLPRLYSISSSKSYIKDEIHLIISYFTYMTANKKRYGVTTNYLCCEANINSEIDLYIQPTSHFHLFEEFSNIIMIATGSGIAPFISFLQERFFKKAKGKNWLFFGECNKKFDFYYEDFLKKLEKENFLKLTTAFSRDQEKKIYVQHRLLENFEKVFDLIEKGAYIYVCGAQTMSKSVDNALLEIFRKKMSEIDAKKYLTSLISKKIYLKDVY